MEVMDNIVFGTEFLEIKFPTINDDISFANRCISLQDELKEALIEKYGDDRHSTPRYNLYSSIYGSIATTVNYINSANFALLNHDKVYTFLSERCKDRVFSDIMDIEDECRAQKFKFSYLDLSRLVGVVYKRALSRILEL